MTARWSLQTLNEADAATFRAALGDIFEDAPWVADAVYVRRPFDSVAALHRAMVAAVADAGRTRQRALIAGHPDLAGKAARAGTLTDQSREEQAGAGLNRLNDAEYVRFERLNAAYREKFGFPFIIAVRDYDKTAILAAFERRLEHDVAREIDVALAQIARIAELRLADRVAEPRDEISGSATHR